MNQTKNRMQALGLLDRAFKATTDAELTAAIEALDDDHREGLESFVEALTPDGVRAAVKAGRINGDMEAIAAIVSDACLADCIKELGDHADNPTTDQLTDVLPGLVDRHSAAVTRLMLAATVAGEAPASAIIRDLLKSDELVALPKAEEVTIAPLIDTAKRSPEDQAAIKAKRAEAKAAKKQADRAAPRPVGRRSQASLNHRTGVDLPAAWSLGGEYVLTLVVEQPCLGVDAAGEPGEGAVRPHHPVTWNDDRDRIPTVRCADGACLATITHPLRLLAVALGVGVRNRTKCGPRRLLEVGADRIERHVEARASAGEVLGELRRCHHEHGVRRVRDRVGVRDPLWAVSRPEHRSESDVARNQRELAHGAVDDGAGQRFDHDAASW